MAIKDADINGGKLWVNVQNLTPGGRAWAMAILGRARLWAKAATKPSSSVSIATSRS